MEISRLRTNHVTEPMGYRLEKPVFSWIVSGAAGTRQEVARVKISRCEDMTDVVYDSGKRKDISSLGFEADFIPEAVSRYYWEVTVWTDAEEEGSAVSWFETGKMKEPWQAQWIRAPFDKEVHPIFIKEFELDGNIASARAYITGLGLYELKINGVRVGDEYLTPYYNDYNLWIQYQTYDITSLLTPGSNRVCVMLGNGWYKGRFGFVENMAELYGDEMKMLCEIDVKAADGKRTVIGSGPDWDCIPSWIVSSSIYDGEVQDARMRVKNWSKDSLKAAGLCPALPADAPKAPVTERLSLPVKIRQRWKKAELLCTPAGETVIDFGQVMTGWVEFDCDLPAGSRVFLQFGELLQNGNFYNENLRTAKEEFTYISDGQKAHVRPHFTFYGFRYMKVEGIDSVRPEDFTACVMYSDLEEVGSLTTSNSKVNRLIENALWSQRGNFVDVPTDCPQRDERMGWTGDAEVFAATASLQMYTPAFYRKFLYDMQLEQQTLGGSVPHVVPDILDQIASILHQEGDLAAGSCAWGDAATVIPWVSYLYYGDRSLLESQFNNMKMWTDFIKREDDTRCGGRRLWQCGFHFADWLALDNPVAGSSFGGTEDYYVASAYYYYSASLTAKAAKALGKEEEYQYYHNLAEEVKAAIQKEYFTVTGRIAIPTQTAMAIALYMDLVPEQHRERIVRDLKKRLDDKNIHLDTGFVGTYQLCSALSLNGMADYAYTLLLNEDFPSWLYEVNMGATTIWERWNSVLPDGLVSDTGMNSMNHYAYGSVVEWMYRYMCGINPSEDAPGFKKARIEPQTDARFDYAKASYLSASGLYRSEWKRDGNRTVYTVEVPFDAQALFVLARPAGKVLVNGEESEELRKNQRLLLMPGVYEITAE